MTGSGIPSGREVPSVEKSWTLTESPSAITRASPLSTDSMPSVVIKAFTPTTVTRKPLTAPARLPTANATTMARGIECPSAAVAMATPDKAMIDATERSNWPAMIKNVPGIATIPVTAIAVRTLRKLARERNAGARIEKVAISTTSTTKRAVIFGRARRRRRDGNVDGLRSGRLRHGRQFGRLVQGSPPAAATISLPVT